MNEDRRTFLRTAGCCACAAMVSGVVGAVPAVAAPLDPQDGPKWAAERFLGHWNCAQAVFEVFAMRYGLDPQLAIKIATSFAGGMGDGRECGAMTGGYLALGLAMGAEGPDGDTMAATARLTQTMKNEFGPMTCSALMGEDMGTPQGVKAAGNKGLFESKCPKLVARTVEIVNDIVA